MTEPSTPGDARRGLPSVDRLLASGPLSEAAAIHGHALAVEAARVVLAEARRRLPLGAVGSLEELAQRAALQVAMAARGTLYPVINATGVIIHTNLGRAPLSEAAQRAIMAVAAGYSNLEFDLEAGERGSRYVHAESLLCKLTGAEAALVVNNNAAAVYLALLATARGREVIISRGQLVEIGGGFRIPDVLRESGAGLIEVGTTNRTHPEDYRRAVGPETALLLRVHSSNFRQIGFTAEVTLAEMVAIGRQAGVGVVDDLGSGTLLDTRAFGLAPEPMVQDSVAAGADLVTFSGDKLLGGPQAGLIVGKAQWVARLRHHPMARALRVGKDVLAALQATLLHYQRGEAASAVPIWRMIAIPADELARRATEWATRLQSHGLPASVVSALSTIGGGALPGEVLPTHAVALAHPAVAVLAEQLRRASPHVVARIVADQLLLDPRTVLPETDQTLLDAVVKGWLATAGS